MIQFPVGNCLAGWSCHTQSCLHDQSFSWERIHPKEERAPFWLSNSRAGQRGKGESQCGGPRVCHSDSCPPTPSYSFLRSTVRDGQQKTQMKIRRIGKLEFKALQFQQEGGWRGGACHPKWSSGWVSWSTLREETSGHPESFGPYTAHWLY